MGKSIKSLLDGKIEVVHPADEPIAQEMFNNTAVFMGDWKAVKNEPPKRRQVASIQYNC